MAISNPNTVSTFNGSARIALNRLESGDIYRLRLVLAGRLYPFSAGQFVMLRLAESGVFLNRPFSPFVVRYRQGRTLIDLLYKVVGPGTSFMAGLKKGDNLELLGPLGRGFSKQPATWHVIVGGGIGIPPLYLLAKELGEANVPPECIIVCLGGRGREDLAGLAEFKRLGNRLILATEDGSEGHRGLVTAPLVDALAKCGKDAALYTCGPTPMLKAVWQIAKKRGLPCQLSLEEMMGCGVGVCFSCVAPMTQADGDWKYIRTCVDGPVVEGNRLLWDEEIAKIHR